MNEYQARYRATSRGKENHRLTQQRFRDNHPNADREYSVRVGRILDPESFFRQMVSVLGELLREFRQERRLQRRAEVEWRRTVKATEERERKYSRAFYHRIWQPCICFDCGVAFETCTPIEWVALNFVTKNAKEQRCRPCQYAHRLANHGHGPRARCKLAGIPYEPINPLVVYERDKGHCQLCGTHTPWTLRGSHQSNAPEIDHVWPIAFVRDGVKSPGHVLSNLQLSCRKCNLEKGSRA